MIILNILLDTTIKATNNANLNPYFRYLLEFGEEMMEIQNSLMEEMMFFSFVYGANDTFEFGLVEK